MSRILLVSKPLGPPWNDSSKNLVRDLAFGLTRHDAVAFGRDGGETALGRTAVRRIHPAARGGFSPGLRENARVLAQLLAGERCDAWHFFFAPNPRTSSLARLSARVRRARVVQTVCSVPREGVALERVLFGERVIVLSAHTEARFLAAGIARERLLCIPPAAPPLVPPDPAERTASRLALGLEPDVPLLLYPGDLEFGSGARLVLEAHARLGSDVRLVLACRAKTPRAREIEAELRARSGALGTSARVRFLGETAGIIALLGASDVVALPSEVAYAKMDYPLVLLEAMALGRPVVVAQGTPAAELASGGGAAAVAPDESSLTTLLLRWFSDDAERTAQGERARAAVLAHFTRERMAQAYELVYDELLS